MSIIWITGLSGAGKSTVAREVEGLLVARGIATTLLDGDAVREQFGDFAYDRSGRLAAAHRMSRLAAAFSAQGHAVVVATISLFHEVHAANREFGESYFEVLLQCDEATLRQRSTVYSAGAGEQCVGLGIAAEFPVAPHLTLNNEDSASAEQLAQRLVEIWTAHVGIR